MFLVVLVLKEQKNKADIYSALALEKIKISFSEEISSSKIF